MRRAKPVLILLSAAGLFVLAAPVAFALNCADTQQSALDMTTRKGVLAALGVLLGSGALVLRGGGIGKLRAYFCAVTALLFAAAQLKELFRDPDHGDYTLKENAPVYLFAPAFQPLPLDRIGRLTEAE